MVRKCAVRIDLREVQGNFSKQAIGAYLCLRGEWQLYTVGNKIYWTNNLTGALKLEDDSLKDEIIQDDDGKTLCFNSFDTLDEVEEWLLDCVSDWVTDEDDDMLKLLNKKMKKL